MDSAYPTEEELKTIEEWDCSTYDGRVGLAEYLEKIWFYDGAKLMGYKTKKLRLATVGWSGNEELIYAIHKNHMFMTCWESSHRGGLYIFKIKHYAK